MAHPYGIEADVKMLLRTTTTKFTVSATGDITAAELTTYVEKADDWVDFKLRRFYSIPLAVSNAEADIVKDCSTHMAAFFIWRDVFGGNALSEDLSPTALEWKAWAQEIMDELIDQAQMGEYLAGETLATTDAATITAAKASHWNFSYNEDVTFTKFDWAHLNHAQVRKNSSYIYNRITSTSTSDGYDVGTTLYVKDTDYEIDERNGKIRRKSGGAITDGQTIRIKHYEYIKDFPSEFNALTPDLAGDYEDDVKRSAGYVRSI